MVKKKKHSKYIEHFTSVCQCTDWNKYLEVNMEAKTAGPFQTMVSLR